MSLHVTEEALEALSAAGYDPLYGARPLRRVIQTKAEDAVAEALLDGRLRPGDTVEVSAKQGEISLLPVPPAA